MFNFLEITFLGYVISSKGVRIDKNRITIITTWLLLVTVKQTLSFLGFTNFYRRFIYKYSGVTLGITRLLKGKATFK